MDTPTKPTTTPDSGQPATSGVSGKLDGDASRLMVEALDAVREAALLSADAYDCVNRYARSQSELTRELFAALKDLVARCDGDEGVRADGSNIQTMAAHAILSKADAL